MRFAAVANQHLHVAGVRRRAIECLRAKARAAHDFSQRRVFSVGQASAQLGIWQKQVPQPLGFCLGLEFLDDGGRLPAVTLCDLLIEDLFGGIDVSIHERLHALSQLLNLRGVGEIHGR